MSVNPLRVQKINNLEYKGGTVIYQMCRDLRVHDNDALLFAQELAKSKCAQLIVNYTIWNYEWEGTTRRFYDWVLPSLQEIEEELRHKNIPLTVTLEDTRLFSKAYVPQIPKGLGAVIIDQLPLTFMKHWKKTFVTHHKDVPLYEVDAHNCIPVWYTSEKQEFAAHTIRRKVHTKLPDFLEDYGKLVVHDENQELIKTMVHIDWSEVSSNVVCREDVAGVGTFIPGSKAGKKVLKDFLASKLNDYDASRNAINIDGQSNLSPYISHGNISRRRIVQELLTVTGKTIENSFDDTKNGSNGTMGSVAAFIEECVVRAELTENFCHHNAHYASSSGFPEWARVTLQKASSDTREYVYSQDQFEKAKTHDPLWNAAQKQMVLTGKMHGYMRMYWAKKILEWSVSPEEAMKIAVYLNDTYELDGRDPGGYVGCAWSIGGVHDRPWFGRSVFGAIRYMAESGVAKRGNVKEYIDRWLRKDKKLF
jgi:deoxyribodipyrimidine photo-lyase